MFVAAYETGSFTAAASRLYATQSGVSQHIRQLESSLGVHLFARSKGGRVEPTPVGHSYYRQCVEILRMHDKAALSIQTFSQGLEGDVAVGIVHSLAQAGVSTALAAFVEEHPSVKVQLLEGFSTDLMGMMAEGSLDFAIVFSGLARVGVRSYPFMRTPEVLISGPKSGRPRFLPMRLRDAGPLKLVVPSANTRRAAIESYCTTYGAEIVRLMELNSLACTLEFVAASDWSVILPAPAIMNERSLARLTINEIVDPPFSSEMVRIEPASQVLSQAAEAFLRQLETNVFDVNDRWSRLVTAAVAEADGQKNPIGKLS